MSGLTGNRRIRTGITVGAALLAFMGTVAGCSAADEGGEEKEPIEGVQTEAPEETADDSDAADVAALEDLYDRYWDAIVRMENASELDASVLEGIATQLVIETEASRLQPLKDNDVHREGEPSIENVTVSVDGDTARIESCKSEEGWSVLEGGEVNPDLLPEEARMPHTYLVSAERTSGQWLISGTLPRKEATITC